MFPRRSIRRWIWPVVLATMGLGFALVPLAQGKLFFYWDNAKQHYAQTKFLHDSLRDGSLPQWWPAAGLGFPVTAEGQAAHYSPLRFILALLFSPSTAMMWELGICFALAGLGTFYFLRELQLSPGACALGGLCQMFGSFSVIFVRNMALHRAMCFFPLVMLCTERFLKRKGLRDLLGAALLIGLQFLTGHPTVAIVTAVSASFYLLVRVFQLAWRRELTLPIACRRLALTFAAWCVALALGFGIAGVQVIPTLMHVKESLRQGGLRFSYAVEEGLSAKPKGLAMLFLPYAYAQGDFVAERGMPGKDVSLVPTSGLYIGTLPIVLALLAVAWSRRLSEPIIALVICWATATALALGSRTPLFPALWSLPVMNGMRYPHRFLLCSLFCLAALAAFGFDRLRLYASLRSKGRSSLSSLPLIGIPLGCLAVCAAAWIVLRHGRGGVQISFFLFASTLVLLGGIVLAPAKTRPLVGTVLVLFSAGDLLYFRARGGYAMTVPESEALAPPAAVQFLKSQPGEFRVMSLVPLEAGWSRNDELRELVQADLCTVWGLDSADFYATLFLKRQFAVREGIVREVWLRAESAAKLTGFLGALNVGYVVTLKDVALPGWDRVFDTPISTIWRNPSLLPRYYLVGETLAEKGESRPEWNERARQRIEDYSEMVKDWSSRMQDAQVLDHILEEPVDYRKIAVVSPLVTLPSAGISHGASVRRLPSKLDTMAFEAETPQPALLVIAESYYPGWRVWVNGTEGRIVRTNWLVTGVPVPAGKSRIELRYITPGFRAGLLLTGFALVLLAALWFLARQAANGGLNNKGFGGRAV